MSQQFRRLGAWSFTSLAALAAAEPTPQPAPEPSSEPLVVTATRLPGGTAATGSAQHLDDEDFHRRGGHANTLDALDPLPGTFTIAGLGGGLGGTTQLSLRGTATADTLLMVDGIPLHNPTATNGQFNPGFLPLASSAGIDVLYGVQPLYGSRAVGGVINQLAATPTTEHEQQVRLEAGSFQQLLGAASASGPIGDHVGYVVGLSAYDAEGVSAQTDDPAGDPSGHEKDGFTRTDGTARLEYHDAWGRIWLSALGIDANNDFDGFNDPEAEAEGNEHDTLRAALGAEIAPGETWTLAADLAWTEYDNAVTFTDFFTGDPVTSDYEAADLYAALRGEWRGMPDWTLSAGADVLQQEGEFPGDAFTPGYEEDLSTLGLWTRAAYGQERWQADATVRGESHSETDDVVTWRVGASAWAWQEVLRLHASLGTGFRAPSLFELNDPNYGNPELEPESSLGWELGQATTLLQGLVLATTYFHTAFEDQISFDPNTFVTINLDGESQVQGLESSLTWEPADGSHRLDANHTYLDAQNDEDETPFFKPRNTATVAATWYWLHRSVWATFSVDWVDRYRVSGAEMDARTLAGLAAGWRIDERFTVYGRVRNLFDTVYAPNLGYSGEPLNAMLGVSAAF